MGFVIARPTAALALTAVLAFAGCGGGSDDKVASPPKAASTAAATSPTTSSSTTTKPATRTSAAARRNAAAKRRAAARRKRAVKAIPPAKLRANLERAKRVAAHQQRTQVNLANLCSGRSAKLPRVPRNDANAMPRYARTVLPTVKRNAAALRKARVSGARPQVSGIAATYAQLAPILAQLADRSTSPELVKVLARPAVTMVVSLNGAALRVGAPHCALPV